MDTEDAGRQQLNRPLILASVMLGMFLAAIEATIVATAIPSIVADLGGFSSYSWVFSAFLLTNASTVLIFGKLSDIYGRKSIFVIGTTIFLVGSTLSGFSTSMAMLIISRFVQGVGAGALMPMATTIVGDIYDKEERAKIQGYLSSVWGISAVTGPLLGGFFVDMLSWRFVFWMNIPLGILAMAGILIFLRENVDRSKQSIDYVGSILIVISVCSLMFILVEGGVNIAWDSALMFILASTTSIGFGLFLYQEKHAVQPMMPFFLWRYPIIRMANLATLTTGMIIIGVSSYLPAFVQGVMGYSATIAGFTLTAMSIGWPLFSTLAGRLLLKIGYRNTSLIGGLFLLIGAIFFFLLSPEKGPLWAGTGSFFIGAGMGMTSTSFIVNIQNVVNWDMRGIATASNMFMRSLGSALGAALLGGMLNNRIQSYLNHHGMTDEADIDTVNQLLDPNIAVSLPEKIKSVLQDSLTSGLHTVYIGILILSVVSFLIIIMMPKREL
ncbi:MAG TPA: MDR family MFS transporter [Bacillota bacterium]|nr:MDR family MFS transporter [Bacillota bacterium]